MSGGKRGARKELGKLFSVQLAVSALLFYWRVMHCVCGTFSSERCQLHVVFAWQLPLTAKRQGV